MPVDPELLDILACPNCKTKVELVKNGTALKCPQCRRVYPIKDDIPGHADRRGHDRVTDALGSIRTSALRGEPAPGTRESGTS